MTSIADGEGPASSTPLSSSSSSSGDDSDDEEYIGEGEKRQEPDGELRIEEVEASGKRKRGRTKREKKKHACPKCPKRFEFPNKLREHLLTHGENRYVCHECSVEQKFDTFPELRAHCKQVHSKANHKCELCSYTNEKPAFVRKHFKLNHIDGVACTIPGCMLKVAKNRLKSHILECHSTTAPSIFPTSLVRTTRPLLQKCFQCSYLPDPSVTDPERRHDDLERHIQIIHENRGRVECSFGCGQFVKIAQLSAHMRKLHPDVSLSGGSSLTPSHREDTNTMTSLASEDVVEVSDRELSDLEEFLEPVRKKPRGTGDYDCVACGSRFKDKYNLNKHVMRVHERSYKPRVVQKPFQCSRRAMKASEGTSEAVCGKAFKTEQALNDHFNVHDDIKPYRCISCDRQFHARDRFAVHLMKYHQMSIKDLNANIADFGESSGVEMPGKVLESASTSEDVPPEAEELKKSQEHPEAPEKPSTSEELPKAVGASDDVEKQEESPEAPEKPSTSEELPKAVGASDDVEKQEESPEAPEKPSTSEELPEAVGAPDDAEKQSISEAPEKPSTPERPLEAPEKPSTSEALPRAVDAPDDVEKPEDPPSAESIPEEEDLEMGEFCDNPESLS